MKKLLSLFMLLAIFTGCSDDKENNIPTPEAEAAIFLGELTVTPQQGSPFGEFSESEIEFDLKFEGSTLTLVMPKIKFVEQMPRWIAFEVKELNFVKGDTELSFGIEETLPYWNGAPYDPEGDGTYKITNLQGSYNYSTQKLTVDFDCYTMHVNYIGEWDVKSLPIK